MSRFVLTAQLQLQAPSNVRQIVQQIQSQLNGVNVNVQVQNTGQAQRQLQQVAQATNEATSAANRMGRAFSLSIRRFAAFSIATRAVGLFTSTLSNAVQTSIDFERQLIKISQVTGKSVSQLRGLTKEITSLSTGFGVASSDLLGVSTILAQAGLSADDTSTALRTLAKAALAPNFDSISETAEGAIAILAQFQEGVGALEKQLGSINAVAGAFAVEASDLIDVIRRTGGVFKASGGDLNELLALFTSVRATTRESAESIGTGLRTIFTRIQRPKTIEFLKQFGVELVDLNGKFVGPYEAIRRLSSALAGLGEGDISFIRIAEELGGFRQIGKVLPLLQQFSTAQSALNVAMKAGDSLTQDAASAQAALAVRIMKVKEEFLALIRSVTETSTFQIMANTALSLASALIKIGDSIKPLLPMLAALAGFKLIKGLGGFFGGMMSGATSGRNYNKGGKVHHFARGGLVPGAGNRDTVPAMLSPGEFVIRKSSVNKMGAGTLAAMNDNRYAMGGEVSVGAAVLKGRKSTQETNISYSDILGSVRRPELKDRIASTIPANKSYKLIKDPLEKEDFSAFDEAINAGLVASVNSASAILSKSLKVPSPAVPKSQVENFSKGLNDAARGNLFETILTGMMNQGVWENNPDPQRPFDFLGGLKLTAPSNAGPKLLFPRIAGLNYIDAKASMEAASKENIAKKIANQLFAESKGVESPTGPVAGKKYSGKELQAMGYKAGNFGEAFRRVTNGAGKGSSWVMKNLGGLIQKFAGGGEVLQRGMEKYLISDVVKSMRELQGNASLSEKDAIALFNSKNSMGDFVYTNFGGPGSKKLPKWLGTYKAPPSASMQKFLSNNATLDANLNRPESYRGARASGRYRRYALGGVARDPKNTLQSFFEGNPLYSSSRKETANKIRDMRSLRSAAPQLLYSSISRNAFDLMAAQTGLNKNPKIPEGTKLFDREKYYDQEAKKIIGRTFRLSGFLSTSKEFSKAKMFLDNADRSEDNWAAMMTIMTKKGAMGVDVEKQLSGRKVGGSKQALNPRTGKMETFYQKPPESESEFTLQPGSRFKVNNSKLVNMMGRKNLWMDVQQFAKGGGVGTDTVPALLTPGEFVVNRSSAQRIGYGNLHRMNKVGKYANGGIVQRFSAGGAASQATGVSTPVYVTTAEEAAALGQACQTSANQVKKSMGDVVSSNKMFATSMATSILQGFLPAIDENSSALLRVTQDLLGLVTTITSVGFALEAFGVSLGANQIMQLFTSGPGGIGSIISNAFKGFKMGASGQAGPTPLGGGVGAKAGAMFGNVKNSISNISESMGLNKVQDTISSSFKYGISEKTSPISRTGKFARVSEQIGGAGKFRQGLADVSARTGSVYGRVSDPVRDTLGRFTKGVKLGSTNKFSLQNILSGQGGRAGFAGKLGGVIGKIPGVGAVGRFAAGTAARVGAAGGLGGIASAAAGPAAAAIGILAAINSAVGAFRDLDGQLNKSIEAGRVEEASKLAVAKSAADFPLIGNLVGGWNDQIDSLLIYFGQAFGGSSLNSVKALAASQAGAVKTQKELDKAQKVATDAMGDFEKGTISASEALAKIRSATSGVVDQEKRASDFALSNTENRAGGISGFGRNVLSAVTFGGIESVDQRNTRLGKQSAEQIRQASQFQAQAFQLESPARSATIRASLFAGQNPDDIRKQLNVSGGRNSLQARAEAMRDKEVKLLTAGDKEGAKAAAEAAMVLEEQIEIIDKELVNLAKEVKSAKEKFAALNLGFRSITSASDAAALKMDNLMSSFEAGNLPAARAAATLEAAMTSAGQNISKVDFNSALSEVNGVFKAFGASQQQIDKFNGLLKGVAGVQREFPSIFETLKKELMSGELKDINNPTEVGKKFKDIVGAQLKASGIDDAAREQILAAMGDVKLDSEDVSKILAGDYSVLEKYLGDAGEEVKKNMKAVVDNYIKVHQQLIEATKQRIDAERNLVEAQKEALDLMMEGREVQAKYGGREVTNQERRQNLLAKSNVEGSRLGLSNIRTGDAPELRRRNLEIMGGFASIEEGRRRDGLANARGFESSEFQKDLEKTYRTQIETIRGLIKLEEDQLKIIEEKNKLEKESLESLVKGDIESFFKQQAAVGARAAIASGDQRSMNLYGAEALGAAASDIQRQKDAGVQSLYGQRLGGAGGLAEAAASAALSSMGVTDMRSAQIMAGTTGEEEASKSRLRELGGLLGETGQIGVQMAEMQVGTATINAEKAELIVNNLATGGNAPVQNRARGGLIYASRGMFVPRGTDTVPAMLTPGEFVVSRAAVQRGNNLQILSAMNGGSSSSSSTQSESVQMSRGGVVKYFDNGGRVGSNESNPTGSFDNQGMNKFAESLSSFNRNLTANIDKLKQTSISIKLDSTNVNVNLNDGGLLKALKEEVKTELLTVISNQFKLDNNGNIRRNQTILG